MGNWEFMGQVSHVLWFDEVGRDDALAVGGKGASLGEMYRNLRDSGVDIPNGYCTTSDSYREFVGTEVPRGTWEQVPEVDGLGDIRALAIIQRTLSEALRVCIEGADQNDSLAMHGRAELARSLVLETPVTEAISNSICGCITTTTLRVLLLSSCRKSPAKLALHWAAPSGCSIGKKCSSPKSPSGAVCRSPAATSSQASETVRSASGCADGCHL